MVVYVYDDSKNRKKVYCPECNSDDVKSNDTIRRQSDHGLCCNTCGAVFLQGTEKLDR